MDIDPYRLPRAVVPRRYDVELTPDLAAATFAGRVLITADVEDAIGEIILNAADLELHTASVDGVAVPAELDEELERLTLPLATPRAPGPVVVEITFSGILNDRLHGFYRSVGHDDQGNDVVIATTQMQATDCRRAFPCWDEPDFKAVFAITLVVDPAHLALSNEAELSRTRREDGRDVVRFADTMVMSTYLVAFVVGPLATSETVVVNGAPIRLVFVPGKDPLAAFGLDAAVACFDYLERYYGIPYPSTKIDFVALPDFAAGAMENVGLITFRENALLVDPATSTQIEQQRIVDVIAHELAHMWFGDLVTMRWWNGIWLNEAFATFMEVEGTAAYRPDWERWASFALERGEAFEVDALASTRPVEYEVRSPHDADGMFDVLTYQKGAAILRMLQQYLGEDRFRDGVRHYLSSHAYGNTETSDLWDAIESVTGEPARRLMDSWIWQPGFPLISASLVGGELTLRQERFGYSAEAVEDPGQWLVPIHVREMAAGRPEHGAADVETKVLLTDDRTTLTLADPGATVVVNAGGHGFFRVAYDTTLLGRLSGHVLAALTTVDRHNLVDDAWAAVVAGRLGAPDFLTFVRGFADETELAVWQAIARALGECDRLVDGPARERFAATVRALIAPALVRLGWQPQPGEDQLTAQLRGLLVRTLAVIGDDPDAQRRCRELFDSPAADSAPAELLSAATFVVAATGDEARFEQFRAQYAQAATPQRQLRYLYALADFPDEALVMRACRMAMTDEVRTQNAPFLLGRAIANRRHGALAWRFVREHWEETNARFPSNTISRMVENVELLNREQDGADVQAFFAEHGIPQAQKRLTQILERQRVNVALRANQSDALGTSLA